MLQCLAVEVRKGLGRSPGPCHTPSASFLGTHRFATVALHAPGRRAAGSGSLRNPASALVATEVAWRYRFHSRPLEAWSI